MVEKLRHESGVWMVTVLLGDESGARLKVHLSNEVRNYCVVYVTQFYIEPWEGLS